MNMLHFDNQSWHYRLVLYVFGRNFFMERDTVDIEASEKAHDIVWTHKPKVVNLCPYCRGVLWSALSLPFVYVWRLFPHKPKEEMTHEETMRRLKRRGKLFRSIGGAVQFPFAALRISNEDYLFGILQIILGIVLIYIFAFMSYETQNKLVRILGPPSKKILWPLIRPIVKYFAKTENEKEETKTQKKDPNIVLTYLHTKHRTICPPICFIDKDDQEKLR